jgi:hypothetical protein
MVSITAEAREARNLVNCEQAQKKLIVSEHGIGWHLKRDRLGNFNTNRRLP